MKRATVETTHAGASILAAALSPDHTEDIETTVEEQTIRTAVTRSSTGSLQATVDDYLVNLIVATETRERIDIENMTTTETTTRQQ